MLFCKGHPDVRHTDERGGGCRGELAIGGSGYVQLPTGFGFPSSGKDAGRFVIDAVRYQTYSGFCFKCGAEGDFVRLDRKPTKVRRRTGHRVMTLSRSADA